MSWPAIVELAESVREGNTKASELVAQSLDAIESKSEFQAIISTLAERAMQRAHDIDAKPAGRLAGVPFIAKDNFLVMGGETTAASNILRGFSAPYQATAVNRLEAEGAICVAKANLDAFAHGSSTENSDFFTTKNPHDATRVAGGSSGGSAAAVMLDMAPFALGSDTGGSIRLPASFCGAVGYKPTYGLVSRSGVVAMASSTDCIGPLTKTVADTAYVMDVMAGLDSLDSTTIEPDPLGYTNANKSLAGVNIGVVQEYMENDGLDSGVKEVIQTATKKLEAAGALIQPISLPSLPLALAVYYVLCPAEVSSNLSRYDGQRYGYSADDASTLEQSYLWSRERGFGREAKRRIMIGTHVLSSGYYDAYYKKAQMVRTKLIREFAAAFEQVDLLLGPTAASTAFAIGSHTSDPLQMYLTDIMTVAANLVGNPAISIPAGLVDGLPVGLQLMAAQRADRGLLGYAEAASEVVG